MALAFLKKVGAAGDKFGSWVGKNADTITAVAGIAATAVGFPGVAAATPFLSKVSQAGKNLAAKPAVQAGVQYFQKSNLKERAKQVVDIAEAAFNPISAIKRASNQFLSSGDAKDRAVRMGQVRVASKEPKDSSMMIWLFAGIAALFLLPKILKR